MTPAKILAALALLWLFVWCYTTHAEMQQTDDKEMA